MADAMRGCKRPRGQEPPDLNGLPEDVDPAMPSGVDILVHRPSGEVVEFEGVEPSSTIGQLKQKLEELNGIPVVFQTLLLGTRVLDSAEKICTYSSDDASRLSLSLVVSLAGVPQALQSGSVESRLQILTFLSQSVSGGDAQTVNAVISCLEEDGDRDVRKAAMEALVQITEKGDAQTINAIIARLEDSDGCVRRAAVEALKGDVQAIVAVTARLEDSHVGVRQAAVRALAQIAEKGDAQAIDAVIARLEDRHEYVRENAVQALAQLAEKGNVRIITAISARLVDSFYVRMAAAEALAQISEKGDVERSMAKCDTIAK